MTKKYDDFIVDFIELIKKHDVYIVKDWESVYVYKGYRPIPIWGGKENDFEDYIFIDKTDETYTDD